MFLDAMNRLHALDGKGNGDIDPPDVVTLADRLDALENHHHQGVSPPRWWGTLGHEIAKMKVTSEGEPDKPKPPAVCEGCAKTDDCKGDHDPAFLLARDKPDCYVEKDTCGTCCYGLWPLRATRTLGRCYRHPDCCAGDPDKGQLISWDKPACPNHKPLKVTSDEMH